MKKLQNFTTIREAIDDLKKIPACDLSDERTDWFEARYVLTNILINVQRCANFWDQSLSEGERKEYIDSIKSLTGLNSVIDLNKKFKLDINKKFNKIIKKESLEFPISVIYQFLYCYEKGYDFSFATSRITEGGWQYSWAAKWLESNGVDISKQQNMEEERNF